MSSADAARTPYRLIFLLPAGWLVAPGRHQPCLAGCVLTIARDYVVTIEGPSRERVFDQARRFLRTIGRHKPPQAISTTLITPHQDGAPGGRDSWTAIINADVAFAPTAMPPHLGSPEPPKPELRLVGTE